MDNPSAFPNTGNSNWNLEPCEGMSLRDWFAGQAFSGVMVNAVGLGALSEEELRQVLSGTARIIYQAADAMLKARNADHA